MNDNPPKDAVPRRGTTPDIVEKLKAAVGQQITVHFPAEIDIITDTEGNPIGVEETAPARTVTAVLGRVRIPTPKES